jgi:F like protein
VTYPDVQEEPAAGPSLAPYEAAFAAAVLAALTAWLASVVAAVLAGFVRFGIAPNIEALWSTIPEWTRRVDGLMPDLAEIARLGWEQGNRDLGTSEPFSPGSTFVTEQLAKTRNLLVRIGDEVYRDIGNALNKAVAEGKDVAGQAAAVRSVLEGTGSENWPARARTIAVTEVSRSWGHGVIAHGLSVQQRLQIPILKRWDSKEDTRVRAAHDRADGQVRPVSQPFIVDGEALMAPGDPSGSPSNVIACRCRPRLRRG